MNEPTTTPSLRSSFWQNITALWKEIETTGPGSVDLVFGRSMPAPEIAEAWFLQAGSTGRILSLEPVPGLIPFERFESLDSERLCQHLSTLPLESSYAILDIAQLRFPSLDTSDELESTSPEKIKVRPQLAAVVPLAHVFQLGLRAAAIAAQRKLRILLVCSGEVIPTALPSAVEACPNLSVVAPEPRKVETAFLDSWKTATAAYKFQGLNAAFAAIKAASLDPVNSAVQRSQFLTAEGLHVRAFDELKPHLAALEAQSEGPMLLGMAQTALLADDRPEAARLMEKALLIPALGFEGFRTAIITAEKLDRDDWVKQLRVSLAVSFPDHSFTKDQQWLAAAEAGDHATCLTLAQAAGDPYRIALAHYWATTPPGPQRFLDQAKPLGRAQDAIWQIARHLARNNDFSCAARYARMVDPSAEWIERAIELRARCLRDANPPLSLEEMESELWELMAYCATHPSHLRARFSVERTLESEISGTAAFAALLSITSLEMQRIIKLLPDPFPRQLAATETRIKVEADGAAALALVTECMRSLGPSPSLVIGSGVLAPEFRPQVTPKIVATLSRLILEFLNKHDWRTAQIFTHWIILFAEALGDPDADLHMILLLLQRMSAAGEVQTARDVAETMLLMVPGKQPAHSDWRRAIVWVGFADNWLRSHNPREALNCIAHAALLIKSAPPHPGLAADFFRTLAQCFRDLGLFPFARQAVETERAIASRHPHLKFRMNQIEQMTITVRAAELALAPHQAAIVELGRDAAKLLLKEEEDRHVAPLLSLVANAIAQLRSEGWDVPADLQHAFDANLARLPAKFHSQLNNAAGADVSVSSLKQLLGTLATARYASDIPNQIRPALLPAHRAIESSATKHNAPLFALGHAILAQPAIALAQLDREENRREPAVTDNARWLGDQIEQNASPERILDAAKRQRASSDRMVNLSFASLCECPLTEWQQHLTPAEALVLVAQSPAGDVFCLVGKDGAWTPPAPSVSWSRDAYDLWLKSYPSGYDALLWEDRYVLKPTLEVVTASLRDLNPVVPIDRSHVIVIPSTELFGFTFSLALRQHGHIAAVSVAPSAIWLARRRATRSAIAARSVAWLGSPASQDGPLLELRRLGPSIAAGRIALDAGLVPSDCKGAELVVIGSHGAKGMFENFSHVTDREETYTPDELAASVAGSRCVILFVCHSGQVDREPFTQESRGLVGALLRRDIDCVIAAPWPLDVQPAARWFEHFLATDPALPVAIRTDQALALLSTNYGNHPVLRNLFTVYGDGGVAVTTTSRP